MVRPGLWLLAVLLPLLENAGFRAGAETNPTEALHMLTVLYALVPSVLKLFAIGLLAMTDLEDAR